MAVGTQFHVLAVDDSLIDRKLIERLLKSSSFGVNSLIAVTVVDSATKALEFLGLQEQEKDSDSESDPDPDHQLPESIDEIQTVNLIITDYSMPGMTGYDLLRKIKGSKYLKDIPVIVMSSENIPSRINRCLEHGAEEFLLKPLRLTDMDRLKPHLLRSSCCCCRCRRLLPPYPEIPLS